MAMYLIYVKSCRRLEHEIDSAKNVDVCLSDPEFMIMLLKATQNYPKTLCGELAGKQDLTNLVLWKNDN